MIPIGDVNPRRHFPIVTVSIIVLNVLVFLYQLLLPEAALDQFILRAGMVPHDLATDLGMATVGTLFTSMFLHGGWMHIIGNMLYLWIFGDNVEDYLGSLGYLLFYLLAGVSAGLAQVAANPASTVPTIGASGAIAGVLGAYAVLFPKARVRTLVIFIGIIRFVQLSALVVLGSWFVLQLFSGLAAISSTASGGIAWFAHIGGFLTGVVVAVLFKKRRAIPVRPGF